MLQCCAPILCLQNKRTDALCYVQDFVKWKGPLFHKFTLSLVDSSPAVRRLAQYLLADTLALKVPPPPQFLLCFSKSTRLLSIAPRKQSGSTRISWSA